MYEVDAANGTLTAVQRRSTEGRGPREFALSPDGRHVVVANQHSNTLVVIERDPRSGRLGDTVQTMEAVSPSDVKFVVME